MGMMLTFPRIHLPSASPTTPCPRRMRTRTPSPTRNWPYSSASCNTSTPSGQCVPLPVLGSGTRILAEGGAPRPPTTLNKLVWPAHLTTPARAGQLPRRRSSDRPKTKATTGRGRSALAGRRGISQTRLRQRDSHARSSRETRSVIVGSRHVQALDGSPSTASSP